MSVREPSNAMRITAWSLATPIFLWLLLASSTKLSGNNPLYEVEAYASWAFWIGLGELTAGLLFIIPRTTVVGGLFLSAHLGGAILFHLDRGEPFFAPSIFVSFWFQSLLLLGCWAVVLLRRPDMILEH
jgi:hypothetical protein